MPWKETDAMKEKEKLIDRIQPRTFPLPDVVTQLTDVLFYDTWIWWIAVQSLANIVLLVCLVREFILTEKRERWLYMAAILPMLSFSVFRS